MEIKLNCENRVLVQGRAVNIRGNKFTLKSEGLRIPCRVDSQIPGNFKDGDYVTIRGKLRYSNEHDSHKLIVERLSVINEVKDFVNHIAIEGYPLEIVRDDGTLSFTLRHNILNNKGEVYRCLVDCIAYSRVADRLSRFMEKEKLYLIVGELVGKDKKVKIDVEYAKDSKAIVRNVGNV